MKARKAGELGRGLGKGLGAVGNGTWEAEGTGVGERAFPRAGLGGEPGARGGLQDKAAKMRHGPRRDATLAVTISTRGPGPMRHCSWLCG